MELSFIIYYEHLKKKNQVIWCTEMNDPALSVTSVGHKRIYHYSVWPAFVAGVQDAGAVKFH